MKPRLLPVLLALTALQAYSAERWEIRYFHDSDDRSLVLNDLRFTTPERGLAVGAFVNLQNGKVKPAGLVTTDGGRTWSEINLPDTGVSLFFLDDDLGWMAGASGIWRTGSFGREWKKVKSARGLSAICFADPEHGWAVGERGAAYETSNGGKDWKEIELPGATGDTVAHYSSVAFANGNYGVIAGVLGQKRLQLGNWEAMSEPQAPEVVDALRLQMAKTVLLVTSDGGKTWKSGLSMSGRVRQVRLTPASTGLMVVQSLIGNNWRAPKVASMVLGIAASHEAAPSIVRAPPRVITTDVHLAANGTAYAAGYEPPGTLAYATIPGKLLVYRAAPGLAWTEMNVDYRAIARRAVLAPAGGNLWLATDTGMILQLVSN